MRKTVVLLGGSNSAMVHGLQKGLREGICGKELEFYNLALGATTSIQNFYEIKRDRNKKILENAELIISESNINEIIQNNDAQEKLLLNIIYRNLFWFYSELYFLNKKILILLFPYQQGNYKTINNLHKKFAEKYGFNFIDMQIYYEKKFLQDFGKRVDEVHQQGTIMKELGKNIIKNIQSYQLPRKLNIINDNPKFSICTPKDMKLINGNLEQVQKENSMYNELTYIVKENTKLKFPSFYNNFNLIAVHTWNHCVNILDNFLTNYSNLNFYSRDISLNKQSNFYNLVLEFHNQIIIADDIIVTCDSDKICKIKEYHHLTLSWLPDSNKAKYCNIISFFLASHEGNYHTEEIDFEALANENIEIPKEYNFNHLIPPVELYKEIIDEYCFAMDPRKLAPLQNQIKEKDNIISTLNQEKTTLQNELNSFPVKKQNLEIKNLEQDLKNKELQSFILKKELGNKFVKNININYIDKNSAKSRIQNHLSYKLGQALITNSKSILGYIRMPFVLSYIKDKHRFEQKAYKEKIKENPNLALPPLETYPDYNEALKEKECFTYKLGEEFIKANKNWYGGGISNLYSKMCLG
ncbi:hypothetical protein [Campylobacter jejuni]|uniref:hypothetical protein n=1 Tax=Campylobacter jejuni TaxID=197 RepID=UPI0032D99E40